MQGNLFNMISNMVVHAEVLTESAIANELDKDTMLHLSVCGDGFVRISISDNTESFVVKKNESGDYVLTHETPFAFPKVTKAKKVGESIG